MYKILILAKYFNLFVYFIFGQEAIEKPEVTASGFNEELRQITGSSTTHLPFYCIFRLFAIPEESRFYILYGYAADGAICGFACAGGAGEDTPIAARTAGPPANVEAIA